MMVHIYGAPGSGKSTLAQMILRRRTDTVAFGEQVNADMILSFLRQTGAPRWALVEVGQDKISESHVAQLLRISRGGARKRRGVIITTMATKSGGVRHIHANIAAMSDVSIRTSNMRGFFDKNRFGTVFQDQSFKAVVQTLAGF